ncbi:MAG: Mpo1-like protein [Isosphaeraceae bacterium]
MSNAQAGSWGRLVAKYRADHQHPVNHFLHVFVGWPMVAAAIFILPFQPIYSVGLVILAYAFMFSGHFLFEKNIPTILKHPTTPFIIAWAVVRGIAQGSIRQVIGSVEKKSE